MLWNSLEAPQYRSDAASLLLVSRAIALSRASAAAICRMTAPIFLHSQTNQNREHHETDDPFFFLGENEH